MKNHTTKSRLKPFDLRKSLLLDRVVIRYEASTGIRRLFWRWVKRIVEYYAMGGRL